MNRHAMTRLTRLSMCAGIMAGMAVFGVQAARAETPDTFTWLGGSNTWDAAGVWTPAATARTAPGIAGDKIVTTNGSTISLTGSATVSAISVSGGPLSMPTIGIVTQTFDSASAAVTNKIYSAAQNISLGDGLVDNDLTLNVVDTLLFSGNHSGLLSVFVRGMVAGGTPEAPISLLTEANNNEWNTYRVHLMNTNSTFRGDVYVGAGGAASKGNVFLFLGHSTVKGADSMLGHPDNRVILRNQRPHLCVSQGSADGLKRRILGTGNVRGLRVNTSWPTLTDADSLTLGDGSSLEPSIEPSNPIGKITVLGTTLTTHPNSRILINVTETTNDVVAFSPTAAFTYSGIVQIEPLSAEIPVGKSWAIMTVAASATAFTFNPASVPTGYSFNTTGNASAGWVVTATKQVDTSAIPAVQNLSATLIAETNATVHADVIGLAPDGEATLRTYFGTVDQESNFGAWEHVAEHPPTITGLGVYARTLNTLEINTTYYVRHSVSNSSGEYMSLDVISFTTRPWATPDLFTWGTTTANWHADGAWTTDTPYQRKIPQFKGDRTIINVGGVYNTAGINRNLNLTNDVTISSMIVNEGYGASANIIATNGPARLTFDADSSGTNNIYSSGQLASMRFGNDSGDYGLTIELKQPLVFRRDSAWHLDVQFYAAIIGGDETNPADIFFTTLGDEYCSLFFTLNNANNAFRGTVYLGATETRLASTMLTIGNNALPAENGMLGDAANTVFLRNNSTLRYHAGTNTVAVVERHVKGTGKVTSTKALHLASNAAVEPQHISGSGVGTITIEAAALTSDDAAQYMLNLSTNGISDKLVFNVASPLTLNGRLRLEPQDDAEMPAGASWAVVSVTTNATAFTSNLSKVPGYRLTTSGDSSSGWTVSAEKITGGTLLEIL